MTPLPQSSATGSAEAASVDQRRQQRRINRLSLFTATLAIVVGVALPAAARMLNLVKVSDFPLGFYVSAQAAPVLLAALLVAFAARLRRIGRQAQGTGSGPSDDHS